MATNVTLNGVSYSIPAVGDSGWGASLSSFLVALPTGVLTKAGGAFTLTGAADFGPSFGLQAASYASRSTPATSGVVRLGNTDTVSWRNQFNTFNIALGLNASDVLVFDGVPVLRSAASGIQTFLTTPSSANLRAAITDESGTGALLFQSGALGTPASGNLTNCTNLSIGGIAGLGTGVADFLATPSSANLRTAVTDETGTGALVFANAPTLIAPVLGTPASGNLTNCTNLSIGGIAGLGANVGAWLNNATSANLAAAVTDETGSGALVFATSPTLVTPALGTPSSGTLTSCTGLPIDGGTTGTLTVARGGTGLTALGTGLQVLRVNAGATALEYATISGLGDVVGPASSVNDRVVLFDGASGKAIKDSGFLGTDVGRLSTTQTFTGDKTFSGALTIPASITVGANTFARSGAHGLTLTTTGTTNVTLPTTGTLATLGGVETFTGDKTFSGTVTMPSTISFTSLGSIVKAGNFAHTLTTTATSNSTFPAGTHTLAALGLAQTFSAAQTFSGGISGSTTISGNVTSSSTSPTFEFVETDDSSNGYHMNTNGGAWKLLRRIAAGPTFTEYMNVSSAGAVTLGPSSGGGRHLFQAAALEVVDVRNTIASGTQVYTRYYNESTLRGLHGATSTTALTVLNQTSNTVGTISQAGAVNFGNIHNIGAGNVTSGTYTPTATGVTNIATVGSPTVSSFSRVGNVVTVTFALTGQTVTTTGLVTRFRITLPVSSNLTAAADLKGCATFYRGSATLKSGACVIAGDATNDAADIFYIAAGVASEQVEIWGTFQYEVK